MRSVHSFATVKQPWVEGARRRYPRRRAPDLWVADVLNNDAALEVGDDQIGA